MAHKGWLIIGGAIGFGLLLAAFALTSLIGRAIFPRALVLIFVTAVFNSTHTISIVNSLQMMVPDRIRGRVMGFYGMTWSIMPMGVMYTGGLARVIGVPIAVATGGLIVSAFALGPALINRRLRNLDNLLRETEASAAAYETGPKPTPTPTDN